MKQVRVALHTADPVIRAGLTRFLQFQPGLRVLPEPEKAAADVLTVATHRLTAAHIADLRRHANGSRTPVVLIVGEIAERTAHRDLLPRWVDPATILSHRK